MEFENICRFVPVRKDAPAIHILNVVFETKPQIYAGLMNNASYKIHYVCSGEGKLHTPGRTFALKSGDLFFTQPAVPFAIESGEGFTYMYSSFLGERANLFIDKLKINGENCLFHDFEMLEPMFQRALDTNVEVADLVCESILLYAFSMLGDSLFAEERSERARGDAVSLIKKYIDENFSDPNLSLEQIGAALNYNKKYISAVFKEKFKVGVAEYLRTVRIQQACALMEQGFTSIKDISALCGFADPLYFSKVFKTRMAVPPRKHIENLQNKD